MCDRLRRAILFSVFSACLLGATPLRAQALGYYPAWYLPPGYVSPGGIYTPEVHLGSADTPSTVTVPQVIAVPSGELALTPTPESIQPDEIEAAGLDAPPASTALLSTRHFDYLVSPVQGVPLLSSGGMADGSISLGEYARRLRAEKQKQRSPQAQPDQR